MADPEKKKRLEALRRKKAELQNMLHSSDKKEKSNNVQKSVEEIAREAIQSADNFALNKNENQSQKSTVLQELMRKKFNDSLRETNLVEFFIGKKPEKYDEYCQCEEQKIEKEEEDTENQKKKVNKGLESFIIKKKQIITNENISNKIEYNPNKKINVLKNEERKEHLEKKEELAEFIKKEKKFMERALNEDVIIDLFKKEENEKEEKNESDLKLKNGNPIFKIISAQTSSDKTSQKNAIVPLMEFSDDSTYKRVVTSLQWSIKHPELLLSSFSKADDFNLNQQNGLVLIWSLALRTIPEFTFNCQAEVTSSIFHTYNTKLIIGGTYTGQVLIWDTRGNNRPVSKTPLGIGSGSSSKTHTSPINSLAVTGSMNSNRIISVSSDVLCEWSIANLSEPTRRINLNKKTIDDKSILNELGALCMGMHQFDSNNLLIGSDDNNIYQISTHGSGVESSLLNSNQNINCNITSIFTGHKGPVYSIDVHPGDYFNMGNFTHLFISSSADWTTRLWTKTSENPLLTLDANEDYVYSCKWCPTNMSVICTGDGSGNLDFWDFNKDLEFPVYRYNICNSVINKLSWTEDGRRLAIGDNSGKIKIVGISPKIYKSKIENSLKFEKVIAQLKIQ